MKKFILAALMLTMYCSLAWAEASFDQIQGLIKEKDYASAAQGLELIVRNHPNSAKAWYAMAQAQAGIGNQAKAQEALSRAKGLDPELKFASSSNVENLKEALQPQTAKIEAVESHWLRNLLLVLLLGGGIVGFYLYTRRKKQEIEKEVASKPYFKTPEEFKPVTRKETSVAPGFGSITTDLPGRPAPYTPVSTAGSATRQSSSVTPQPSPQTTVVNNGGHAELVTGMVLGHLMADNASRNVVHEREVVHEAVKDEPESATKSSWDSNPSSSWGEEKSSKSSWDSGSSISSSWDSGSSSSSSWDSGSSSSSSWDSGSSCDSSSSSSWD